MGRTPLTGRGPGAWRLWAGLALVALAVGATIWKVHADTTYTLTTQQMAPGTLADDGKYSNQPFSTSPMQATTTQQYINLTTSQPLNTGDVMGGGTPIWVHEILLYEADPDGRPLATGGGTAYGGNGFTAYDYPQTNPTYDSNDFKEQGNGVSIVSGIVSGGGTWGGRYRLCGEMYSTATTYGDGSWRGDLVHMHQATNSGTIRIICRQSGAYIDAQVTGFPFPSNHAVTITDHSNFATGVTFDDLPGGSGQDFYITPWGHFFLNVPVGGYAVYTIEDGQVSGGQQPTITATPSSVPKSQQVNITLVGHGTSWDANTNFGVGGVAGCGLRGIASRSSDYQTVTLICYPGDAAGTLTFGEGVDSAQATVTVTDPNAPTPTPSPTPTPAPTPTPSASGSPTPSPSPSTSPSASPTPTPTPCPSGDTTCVPGAQPVDTDSFWKKMFVPSTTNFQQWDDLRAKFGAWGPVGFINSFTTAWSASSSGATNSDCANGPTFHFQFGFGSVGTVDSSLSLACSSAHTTSPTLGGPFGDLIWTVRPYLGYGVYILGIVGLVKILWPRSKA